MTVLITTNEPAEIKKLFEDKLEIPMGFDFLLYTRKGKVGIERKAVPGDLIASVTDGRLAREIGAMRQGTQFQVVLLHGYITYRRDGTIYARGHHGRPWTKKGIRNLKRTICYCEGCYIEEADNDADLVAVIDEIQEYFDGRHLSLRTRLGLQTNWMVPSRQEKVMYFYSGLPGISTIRARALAEKFAHPIDLYRASVEDLMLLSGFGKNLATKVYNFLREG